MRSAPPSRHQREIDPALIGRAGSGVHWDVEFTVVISPGPLDPTRMFRSSYKSHRSRSRQDRDFQFVGGLLLATCRVSFARISTAKAPWPSGSTINGLISISVHRPVA